MPEGDESARLEGRKVSLIASVKCCSCTEGQDSPSQIGEALGSAEQAGRQRAVGRE